MTTVPAPAGSTGWGRGFLQDVIAMQDVKTRREIAERETRLKEIYYRILGKDADLRAMLAPLEKRRATADAEIAEYKAKQLAREEKVRAQAPWLTTFEMMAKLQQQGASQALNIQRLTIQQMQQQISGLTHQLSAERFTHTQEKDRKDWLFNIFLNPDITKPIKEAIGEDEFEMRKGKAMEEFIGVDKRQTPVSQGIIAGIVKEPKTAPMTFEEASASWRSGKTSFDDFWAIWADKIKEQTAKLERQRAADMLLKEKKE